VQAGRLFIFPPPLIVCFLNAYDVVGQVLVTRDIEKKQTQSLFPQKILTVKNRERNREMNQQRVWGNHY
jgi:hypothetical protein